MEPDPSQSMGAAGPLGRVLPGFFIAVVLAPVLWQLLGRAALLWERLRTGEWPSYAAARRSSALLQWMMESELGPMLWLGHHGAPLLLLVWLLAQRGEGAGGAGIARIFGAMAALWAGTFIVLVLMIWGSGGWVF
jgi:hypothetical protein